MEQKQKRNYDSSDNELIKVTWKHTWEPEEPSYKWPTCQKHIVDFEAHMDVPDLAVPSAV